MNIKYCKILYSGVIIRFIYYMDLFLFLLALIYDSLHAVIPIVCVMLTKGSGTLVC